jgi:hypothetical protein
VCERFGGDSSHIPRVDRVFFIVESSPFCSARPHVQKDKAKKQKKKKKKKKKQQGREAPEKIKKEKSRS